MSKNLLVGLATAALILVITVMELVASAKHLPHDGVQPPPTTSVQPTGN